MCQPIPAKQLSVLQASTHYFEHVCKVPHKLYGIPEFRLPNKIVDVEIDNLSKMGVKFMKDCIVGKTISVEDLEGQAARCGISASEYCRTLALGGRPM